MTTWRTEHGADYAVPEWELRAAGFTDYSWHNDACPRFGYDDDCRVCIWIEHPDPKMRGDTQSEKRFIVELDPDGCGNPDKLNHLFTDDLNEAIRQAQEWRKEQLNSWKHLTLGGFCE